MISVDSVFTCLQGLLINEQYNIVKFDILFFVWLSMHESNSFETVDFIPSISSCIEVLVLRFSPTMLESSCS